MSLYISHVSVLFRGLADPKEILHALNYTYRHRYTATALQPFSNASTHKLLSFKLGEVETGVSAR